MSTFTLNQVMRSIGYWLGILHKLYPEQFKQVVQDMQRRLAG